jgi:hypothetical protein
MEYRLKEFPMARKNKFWRRIKVPKPMTCNTGEQAPAYEVMKVFFQEVEENIRKIYPNWPLVFKKVIYPLYPEELVGKTGGGPTTQLEVLFCGDRPVCSVLITSTDLNYDQFSFSLFKPRFPWASMHHGYQRGEYD